MTQDVVVGYLHGDQVTQEFHHCLLGMFIHDMWGPRRVLNFAPQLSGTQILRARNQMVRDMLDQDRAEWLWMLDSDATFRPDTLDRLLAAADIQDRPIVGALAHQIRSKIIDGAPVFDRHGFHEREIVPTMYRIAHTDDGVPTGYQEIASYPVGLQEIDATGAHCLLVHRTVFEKIESDHPYRWFREDEIAPELIAGEDIWFCLEARRHGFPVFVDTSIESGHVKRFVVTSEMSHIERTA